MPSMTETYLLDRGKEYSLVYSSQCRRNDASARPIACLKTSLHDPQLFVLT